MMKKGNRCIIKDMGRGRKRLSQIFFSHLFMVKKNKKQIDIRMEFLALLPELIKVAKGIRGVRDEAIKEVIEVAKGEKSIAEGFMGLGEKIVEGVGLIPEGLISEGLDVLGYSSDSQKKEMKEEEKTQKPEPREPEPREPEVVVNIPPPAPLQYSREPEVEDLEPMEMGLLPAVPSIPKYDSIPTPIPSSSPPDFSSEKEMKEKKTQKPRKPEDNIDIEVLFSGRGGFLPNNTKIQKTEELNNIITNAMNEYSPESIYISEIQEEIDLPINFEENKKLSEFQDDLVENAVELLLPEPEVEVDIKEGYDISTLKDVLDKSEDAFAKAIVVHEGMGSVFKSPEVEEEVKQLVGPSVRTAIANKLNDLQDTNNIISNLSSALVNVKDVLNSDLSYNDKSHFENKLNITKNSLDKALANRENILSQTNAIVDSIKKNIITKYHEDKLNKPGISSSSWKPGGGSMVAIKDPQKKLVQKVDELQRGVKPDAVATMLPESPFSSLSPENQEEKRKDQPPPPPGTGSLSPSPLMPKPPSSGFLGSSGSISSGSQKEAQDTCMPTIKICINNEILK